MKVLKHIQLENEHEPGFLFLLDSQDGSFPHHFSLLSTEPLYYAAMFSEGGGIDATEGLDSLHNGACSHLISTGVKTA